MTRRLLVLLLLSASILLYRGADLVQWLRGVPEASSFGRVDLRDGRMVVLAVPPEDLDGRPTAAARIGLKVDDAVVAFERADGARVPMTGLNLVGETMKSLPRSGGGAMIVLRKEGNAEREVRLPLLARPRPGPISVATRLARQRRAAAAGGLHRVAHRVPAAGRRACLPGGPAVPLLLGPVRVVRLDPPAGDTGTGDRRALGPVEPLHLCLHAVLPGVSVAKPD